MILVDTSVWIDHFRHGSPSLASALEHEDTLIHPFVIGELACGRLQNRVEVLELLAQLPQVDLVTDQEAMALTERRQLMGKGIGYIDVHLLASVLVTPEVTLWTRDRRLAAIADELRVGFDTGS